MKKRLRVTISSLIGACGLLAGAFSAAQEANLPILPFWKGPNDELTEQETETETEAMTEETEAVTLDSERLSRYLSLYHLKYGSDFTFAMNFPEVETPPSDPRYHLEQYLRLTSYPLPHLPETILNLESKLESLIASYSGSWSVYAKNLMTGDVFILNDAPMKSASIMKLFIMAAVYEAIQNNELEHTSEIMDLLNNMIVYSSNEAANRLLYRLGNGSLIPGVEKVNQYIRKHGYSVMSHEYNGFEDSSTILDAGHFNQISAKDCGVLLEQIYHRNIFSRKVCNEIESMMLNQQTRYKIPKGLPDGVSVGNKTGEMDTVENDVAIVYAGKCDYILCVFSSDWRSKEEAQRHIQEISSTVYHFFNQEDYYLIDDSYRVLTLPEEEPWETEIAAGKDADTAAFSDIELRAKDRLAELEGIVSSICPWYPTDPHAQAKETKE